MPWTIWEDNLGTDADITQFSGKELGVSPFCPRIPPVFRYHWWHPARMLVGGYAAGESTSCSSVIEYSGYFDIRDCQTPSSVLRGVLPVINCCGVYFGQVTPLVPSTTTSKLPFSCWRTATETSGEPSLFRTALRPLIILGAMFRFYLSAPVVRASVLRNSGGDRFSTVESGSIATIN